MSAPNLSRGDLDVYERSVRLEVPEVVNELLEALGAKLVATWDRFERRARYGNGPTSTTSLSRRLRWSSGCAWRYRCAAMLRHRDSAQVVQAWFLGALLGDVARRGCSERAISTRSFRLWSMPLGPSRPEGEARASP